MLVFRTIHILAAIFFVHGIFARNGPPRILSQPNRRIIFSPADDKVVLTCKADGSFPIRFSWEHFGTLVNLGAFDAASVNGEYTFTHEIKNPSGNDEGEYVCYVSNDYGLAITDHIELVQAVLGTDPKSDLTYNEDPPVGEGHTLPCEIPNSVPTPTISWIKRDIQTGNTETVTKSRRMVTDADGNLHFVYIDKSDEGYYRCQITNTLLQTSTFGPTFFLQPRDDNVNTNVAPYIIWNTYDMAGLYKRDLTLKCIFAGRPIPDISWTGDNGAPINSNMVRDFGRELVLSKLNFNDAGSYQCQAGNGIDGKVHVNIQVTVEREPEWIQRPQPLKAYPGEEVSFTCEASGIPAPSVRWYIDSVPITASQNPHRPIRQNTAATSNSAQSVLYFRAETSFTIQCTCENAHDYISANAYLYVPDDATPPFPTQEPPTTTANPPTTTTAKQPKSSAGNTAVIGGAVGGCIVLIIIAVVAGYCVWSRRRNSKEQTSKPVARMAYRNNGFTADEQPNSTGADSKASYTGLGGGREKQSINVYDELGGASNSPRNTEETEYCYISDSDLMDAQRQLQKPVPSVSKSRAEANASGVKSKSLVASGTAIDYKTANDSTAGKLKHFASGKYSSPDDPVYRGNEGHSSEVPQLPPRYEEPVSRASGHHVDPNAFSPNTQPPTQSPQPYEEPHSYFILQPELTYM